MVRQVELNFSIRSTINRGSLGGSVQAGGGNVISWDEAFLVFGKWAEDRARLRIDSRTPACRFSCVGFLQSVDSELLRFRLDDLGFIEIHLPVGSGFEYGDPDPMRVAIADRIGEGHTGQPVRYGASLAAIRETGETFLFVEVIESA
jgi:hypothetical protein